MSQAQDSQAQNPRKTPESGASADQVASLREFQTVDSQVGNTPLVRLQRMNKNDSNTILLKLEGNNPAGSVKDRPAYNMILQAELRGDIKPGDTLIEATSGNTGIALAMVAAIKGYKMVLVMPETMSEERKARAIWLKK